MYICVVFQTELGHGRGNSVSLGELYTQQQSDSSGIHMWIFYWFSKHCANVSNSNRMTLWESCKVTRLAVNYHTLHWVTWHACDRMWHTCDYIVVDYHQGQVSWLYHFIYTLPSVLYTYTHTHTHASFIHTEHITHSCSHTCTEPQ